jgi:hypothetical protein
MTTSRVRHYHDGHLRVEWELPAAMAVGGPCHGEVLPLDRDAQAQTYTCRTFLLYRPGRPEEAFPVWVAAGLGPDQAAAWVRLALALVRLRLALAVLGQVGDDRLHHPTGQRHQRDRPCQPAQPIGRLRRPEGHGHDPSPSTQRRKGA